MIHSAIHTARPDVLCAAHTHSIHGRAFSTLGRELDMLTQDACAFYKDHAVYRQFNGVVLAEEEGVHIARALGNKKVRARLFCQFGDGKLRARTDDWQLAQAVILQNHGLLVATNSIDATLHYFIVLEKSCHVQLMAEAAAASRGQLPITISDKEAEETYKVVGTLRDAWFGARPQFQMLEHREGVRFQFKKANEQ